MSKFYGTIQGNRGMATKGGSKSSGFKSSAQSWDGSVITNLRYEEIEPNKEMLKIRIDLADDSRSSMGTTYFSGTLDELKECFKLYEEVQEMRYKQSLTCD